MVILGDIFDLLANSEVLNTKLSRSPNGALDESEYVKVVGHLNLGLVELYKRFNLRQEELRLHILPEVSRYYLRPERISLLENMDESTYIEEIPGCLTDLRVIKVAQVRTENDIILPVNDNRALLKIICISEDILHIYPIPAPAILTIVYQAFCSKIEICDDFVPTEYELEISDTIIEPLLDFTAARILASFEGDAAGGVPKSVSYLNQYEMACQKIEQFGLHTEISDHNMRFEKDGWT